MSKPSLEEFVTKYKTRVEISCSYELRRYGGLLNHIDIHEFTQDVWVTILRNFDRFDPLKSAPATWIIRIARCQGAMYARRERVRAKSPTLHISDLELKQRDDGKETVVECLQEEPQQEDDLERAEIRKDIDAAVSKLEKKYQVIIWYIFYQGMNMKELHRQLCEDTGADLPLEFIGRLKARAIKRLRRSMYIIKQGDINDESPINALELRTTTLNKLVAVGILTVGQLILTGPSRLASMPGFKISRIMNIKTALRKHRIEFIDRSANND